VVASGGLAPSYSKYRDTRLLTMMTASSLWNNAHHGMPPILENVETPSTTKERLTMQAHTTKQEALAIIQRLPDTADIEEIMYRLYVLENIRRGQHDAEQDKSLPTEQVLRDIRSW